MNTPSVAATVCRARTLGHQPIGLGLRKLVLLAVLTAFLWQSYIVQSHIHPHRGAGSASVWSKIPTPLGIADGSQTPTQPAKCPICQEVSASGVYLLPPAVTLNALQAAEVLGPIVAALVSITPSRSHAWHSRAPPFFRPV